MEIWNFKTVLKRKQFSKEKRVLSIFPKSQLCDLQELTENALRMWDTNRPWSEAQTLVQDNTTLVGADCLVLFTMFVKTLVYKN